jgi:hypothetical protein
MDVYNKPLAELNLLLISDICWFPAVFHAHYPVASGNNDAFAMSHVLNQVE